MQNTLKIRVWRYMATWNTVIDNGKMSSQGFQSDKSEKNTTNKNIHILTNIKKECYNLQ